MSNAITIVAPQNIEESERLSLTLSKSPLLPEALRGKPSDVLVTILSGAELGLAPLQAIRGISIIQGKPALSADLMGALVKRRREICEYLLLVEGTGKRAVYRTKRVGEPEPTTMAFSIEDASAAGLVKQGGMYSKYPANMLRARCLANICRAVYPDLCMGLYDSDSGELTEGIPTAMPEGLAGPVVEREVNAPPPPPPLATKTESVKEQLRAKAKKIEIVDMPDPASLGEPSILLRISTVAARYGITDGKKLAGLIEGATGKKTRSDLTEDDVSRVEDALAALPIPAAPAEPF